MAFGQVVPAQTKVADSGADSLDEVMVTGTLIRGAGPVGSYEITVDPSTIQAQGVVTTDDLLATIPQVSNLFNNVPGSVLNIAPNQIQVVTPNLRNLSPPTGSSSSTLVLVDGHRIAGVGVTQSAVDPDVIPPGAIEGVEVVLDGGSATYGTTASVV
jgi:iron complex outermembrane recepter protein